LIFRSVTSYLGQPIGPLPRSAPVCLSDGDFRLDSPVEYRERVEVGGDYLSFKLDRWGFNLFSAGNVTFQFKSALPPLSFFTKKTKTFIKHF